MSNAAPLPGTGGLNKLVNELLELSKGNLTSLAEATTESVRNLRTKTPATTQTAEFSNSSSSKVNSTMNR
jgi:hypothetical protein